MQQEGLFARLQALAAVSACCVSDAIKGNIPIKASTSDSESDQDRQPFIDHQPNVLFPRDWFVRPVTSRHHEAV